MKLRALDIQLALWRDLAQGNQLVMPNYTPKSWFECDVLSVTKAGYWSEFEIKLTVADFKVDAKKCDGGGWKKCKETGKAVRVGERFKHQELALGSEDGPSFFWYVIPYDLREKIVAPEWAGLMLATSAPTSSNPERLALYPKKPAPRLHKAKLAESVLTHARGVCYWRYWNMKSDLQKSVRREIARGSEEKSSVGSDPD